MGEWTRRRARLRGYRHRRVPDRNRCWIASRIFPWSAYRDSRARTIFVICIFITLGTALVITAFGRMRGRLDQQELARQRAMNLASEAQLASLESRLHPHFLFNTLNSVSSSDSLDPARAERLIERMAACYAFRWMLMRVGWCRYDRR